MSPGLPGFTLQTADNESRFTGFRIPLLYFPLKTVQTRVVEYQDESVNMLLLFVENRVKIRGNLRNLQEFEMREHFF